YLFAVNSTPDENDPKDLRTALRAASAKLEFPSPGAVYDALVGGPVSELALKEPRGRGERSHSGTFRFGPGQMRVFARTARPIGGIRVATPLVQRDLVLEREPITVDI